VGYVGAKSRQRWLFYAYDRIRRAVVAHVFGERTMDTLEHLLELLSAFDVVVGVSLEIGNYCTLSLFFEQIALSQ
jgi:IS1 family transposase